MKALIVFHTVSGHTLEAADYLEQGLLRAGFEVEKVHPENYEKRLLDAARVVLVGSPCHAGSIPGCDGISGPIRKFLGQLPENSLAGRSAMPFCVHSRYGGGTTLKFMSGLLKGLGADTVLPGIIVRAGSCLSLWPGPGIGEADANAMREVGNRIKAMPDMH